MSIDGITDPAAQAIKDIPRFSFGRAEGILQMRSGPLTVGRHDVDVHEGASIFKQEDANAMEEAKKFYNYVLSLGSPIIISALINASFAFKGSRDRTV
jgi:hypothetical protein